MIDFEMILSDACPDDRFTWRLVVEVAELLERHGFTATEMGDPDMDLLQDQLHDICFGRECKGWHR